MLTSKEVMARSGISRATLNNYIALGILPRPKVASPELDETQAPRIGYFDDTVIARIEEVQRLKREGVKMADIAGRLADVTPLVEEDDAARREVPPTNGVSDGATPSPVLHSPTSALRVTIDALPYPAYMVNNNFEVQWWNQEAAEQLFATPDGLEGEIRNRNLFRLLLRCEHYAGVDGVRDALGFHLAIAKRRLSADALSGAAPFIGDRESDELLALYHAVEQPSNRHVLHQPAILRRSDGSTQSFDIFATFFREGILFAYAPPEAEYTSLLDLLASREKVINDLFKDHKPFLTRIAVLSAELEGARDIQTALQPTDYFDLINDIWNGMEPVFRRFYGTHGKHVGDGMLYYFFPQPDCHYVANAMQCAVDLRESVREISRNWRQRFTWIDDLHLNIGLSEGQEWFGSFHTSSQVEFTVLGNTSDHAALLSQHALEGSILATKDMLGALPAEELANVRYGITKRDPYGKPFFVPGLSTSLANISGDWPDEIENQGLAELVISEITDIEIKRDAAQNN